MSNRISEQSERQQMLHHIDASVDETQQLVEQAIDQMGGYGATVNNDPPETDNENTSEQQGDTANTATNSSDNNDDDGEARNHVVERLTRRLRCLFSAITWPIVPLGSMVSLTLIWVLYSAFIVDVRETCSHPLHGYSIVSLVFLIYAPYHAQIRSYLFQYSRERDGPIRPTRVRLYDQLFHTLAILYVYGGVTVLQTCKQDTGSDEIHDLSSNSTAATTSSPYLLNDLATPNSCQVTCPHLYSALDLYVTMLELFTLSLVLPLLFLPCIYLWILRRASNEAEAFWQESLEDDDLFASTPRRFAGNRVTAHELMNSLEIVRLIQKSSQKLVLRSTETGTEYSVHSNAKECCICMSDFDIHDDLDDAEQQPLLDRDGEYDRIVRTKCGHCFHEKCLAGWIGGRWDPSISENRRARRHCCPLCREDLRP